MLRSRSALLAALALTAAAVPVLAGPVADPTVPAARDTEPVILTGAAFADWAVPANVTAKAPLTDLRDCQTFDERCRHNSYSEPEVDSARVSPLAGTPVDQISGWRWDGSRFVQVPFQVDEVFTRYLNNSASGFSHYSGEDQHTTYAFDREGFRYTRSAPDDVCRAVPDSPVATDPVRGLDTNDEVVFMAADAGPPAPATAALPAGVTGVRAVEVRDPLRPGEPASVLYVMRGAAPAFTAANGYVQYTRDANADVFAFSESSYDGYGNAAVGPYCDENGTAVVGTGRRRPRDGAWITTDRYRFRYDGRWLMTALHVAAPGGGYGPDVVDRWKARAFQQDPGSETPCCGYEEEDTNWGGSSTLLGERSGPVRTVRETWGADSGTNVIRRETFYRAEIRQKTWLRVHPIPPLDGIYAQWDYAAGVMSRFYTPRLPAGVAVDGVNDEVFGNLDDPCHPAYDANTTSQADQTYRALYRATGLCEVSPYHQSVDVADPTMADPNVALTWTQITGPSGTVVSRYSTQPTEATAAGLAQSLVALPYYRDDSCFDDGTGTDPGPKLRLRSADEPTVAADGTPRRCWQAADGPTGGSDHFYQGSIGTHGLHLFLVAESDNARQAVPVSEIVAEQRQVVLTGERGYETGERYGRGFEKPLVTTVRDASFGAPPAARSSRLAYTGDTTAAKNGPVRLAARLTGDDGTPVAGAALTFTFAGRTLRATTGADGVGVADTTYPGNSKGHDVVVRFDGDPVWQPCEARGRVDHR